MLNRDPNPDPSGAYLSMRTFLPRQKGLPIRNPARTGYGQRQGQEVRSATKRMLGPAESKMHMDEVFMKPEIVHEHDLFPGRPASANESACICMNAAEDEDGLCLSGLVRGGRCSRKRTRGNYCKQHAHELRKPEKKMLLWSLGDVVGAERWEPEQVAMALSASPRPAATKSYGYPQ